jgi:two-component system sensor histidine kinase PhoQ
MTRALGGRLLIAQCVLLALFFGATMIALDNAYRRALERGARERMAAQALALMASAELDDGGRLVLPTLLPDPALNQIASGSYGLVADAAGNVVWRSASMLGLTLPPPSAPPLGERRFRDDAVLGGQSASLLTIAIEWEEAGVYRFTVAESQAGHAAQVGRFRTLLFSWFGLVALAFIALQALLLRHLLRPLRQVADDVRAIELGRAEQLGGVYPAELDALVHGLNALVRNERARLLRYRNSLGDLAHSLKTPLAVIRRALEEGAAGPRPAIAEQVQRLDELVEYHLQRAASAGGTTFGAALEVKPQAERIVATLAKVHAARGIGFELAIDPTARFHGDGGDLLELLGNLGDNAAKHARSKVLIGAVPIAGAAGARAGLRLLVADDGPGFPADGRETLLQRGVRGDSVAPGHGIGLAIVDDLVALKGGRLTLGRSELGGAEVVVELPPL